MYIAAAIHADDDASSHDFYNRKYSWEVLFQCILYTVRTVIIILLPAKQNPIHYMLYFKLHFTTSLQWVVKALSV